MTTVHFGFRPGDCCHGRFVPIPRIGDLPMGVAMPEETGLDTAIPAIGWQDTARESPPQIRRQRAQKKKKQLLPAPTTRAATAR